MNYSASPRTNSQRSQIGRPTTQTRTTFDTLAPVQQAQEQSAADRIGAALHRPTATDS
jgi:hypothetical protein